MPQNQAKAENPRFEAMKNIVNSRLNETSTEEGLSLRETMVEQGMEMVDLDAPVAPDVKDSDTHAGLVQQGKEHEVDITDDTLVPEDAAEGIKTEVAEKDEVIGDTPEVKADEGEGEEVSHGETADGLPVYSKDGKYYTKITLDGVEQEIDFDTLKASAQKDQASFKRFQDAARKEQEVAAREAKLNAAIAKNAVQQTKTPAVDSATLQAEIDKLYDALAYEDEDAVKAKIEALVSGHAQADNSVAGRDDVSTQRSNDPRASDDVIEEKVQAALERQALDDWETARVAAVEQWQIDYEDIASDPELRAYANWESGQIANKHPNQPLETTLKQAGDLARARRDNLAGKPQGKEPAGDVNVEVDTTDRSERKRSAPAPVRTNSTAASKQVEDNTPPSRSEVVASIKAGRGQTV